MNATHNLHIASLTPLPSPARLRDDLPITEAQENAVTAARADVEAVLRGDDDRLLVVVGPCSVHDPLAAVDYARRLARVAEKHRDDLLVVMRVYFEKPRSTGGWKGLINDPALDGTHDVTRGLRTARYSYARTEAGPMLLFDNENDPFQKSNLIDAAGHADLIAGLDAQLAELMKKNADSWSIGSREHVEEGGKLYQHQTFYSLDEYFEWAKANPEKAK